MHIFLEELLKTKEGKRYALESVLLRAKAAVKRTAPPPRTDFWQMESIMNEDIHIGF